MAREIPPSLFFDGMGFVAVGVIHWAQGFQASIVITSFQDRGDEMKLNVRAFALSCGLVWGFGLLFITLWIIAFDGATGEPTLIGRVYRGYSISPVGSLIGLAWALPDGLIGGAIFAWVYNLLVALLHRRENAGAGAM